MTAWPRHRRAGAAPAARPSATTSSSTSRASSSPRCRGASSREEIYRARARLPVGAAGVLVPAARRARRVPLDGAWRAARRASARWRWPAASRASRCWPSAPTARPSALALKFNDMPDDERELLVLAGDLHDFDVGAAPMPDVLRRAAGDASSPARARAVRASLLWVERRAADATDVERAELLPRAPGRRALRARRAEGMRSSRACCGFVSRWGALCVDDDVVAMAAVPASARATRRRSRRSNCSTTSPTRVLGDGAGARELVRAIMEDFGAHGLRIAELLGTSVRHFESEHWTRYVGLIARPDRARRQPG